LSFNILRRAALVAAVPAILIGASALPAQAYQAVGLVDVNGSGPSGSVSGTCAYSATLPDASDFNNIDVAFSGSARATASKVGVAPVSTSIVCYLRNQASGSAGITMPGSAAAIAGKGSVYRLAPDPEICATVAAAFSDGNTAGPTTACHNL
jgi:hypothetical protein